MTQQNYDASHIKVLEGLEPVRQRPGMYIGSTDTRGLHHCVQEIVDNAVDEAIAGHCKNITVIMNEDGTITVHDDGRGIPVDKHEKTGKSALETVMTVLHAGGKFEKSAYKISGGLHGVGASVVNALSEELTATIHKNGKKYQQTYHIGVPQGDIQEVGPSEINGTTITFKPDKTIFETVKFSYLILSTKLKYASYLTPGVTFTIVDEGTGQKERFYFEGGIRTWLKNLVDNQQKVTSVFSICEGNDDIHIDLSFQYVDSTNDNILSFVNNINTSDGGTHVTGFKSALLRIINEFAKEKGAIDAKVGEFQPTDINDGLYAIINVKIPEPQFEGQTKGKLGNSYVKKEVEQKVYDILKDHFRNNEGEFTNVLAKVSLSAKARLAAKLAKETILRKNAFIGSLPGKLSDCGKKDRAGTELYIVEGESAGGSAKQGRDSNFQAILPLKGKILNTEQAMLQKILANEEVKNLITVIGAGVRESFDVEKIRYDRIIIMTDADVDGAHIRTLLLTFFFRYMRPLIQNGNLYIAVPPLFKLYQGKKETNKKEVYIYDPNADFNTVAKANGLDPNKFEIQRYKGLGEMNPEQLRSTTMDPETRKMLQVSVEDAEEADKLFRILMGEDASSRKHFILAHAKNVRDLDI